MPHEKIACVDSVFKQFDERMEFISSMGMFSPFGLMFNAAFSQYVRNCVINLFIFYERKLYPLHGADNERHG